MIINLSNFGGGGVTPSGYTYSKAEIDGKDATTLTSANTYTDEALDDYYTKTDVDSALSGKQDTLTAGENITIVDNVISATGGGAKNEPLCIEVVGLQANVYLAGAGVLPYLDLQYSYDKETWTQYNYDTIVLEDSIEGNKKVYFKGNNPEGFHKYGDNAIIEITGSNVKLSGNIMSLISEDATEIPVNSCFTSLFRANGSNATIVDASGLLLPATVLKPYCYEYMFYGQYNMQYPPELPATELEDGCYHQMFCECWGLLKFPSLMAHEIPQYAYKQMFNSSHYSHRDSFVILADNIHIDGATDMFAYNNDISTIFISPNCPLDLITQFDSRSRLVNYLTEEEQIIAINNLEESKASTGYVDTKDTATLTSAKTYTDEAVSGKQDTLIAGENITISGNVISATGGGESGVTQAYVDTQDTATLNSAKSYVATNYYDKAYTDERYGVISASLNDLDGRMVLLTQAQYDALETKNPKVLYLIYEE